MLEPCSHCGQAAKLTSARKSHRVYCTFCYEMTRWCPTKGEAIEGWNTKQRRHRVKVLDRYLKEAKRGPSGTH